jgi:hypothetical protein
MKNVRSLIFPFGLLVIAFPMSAQVPLTVVPAAGDPLYAPVVTSDVPETLSEKFMDYSILSYGPRSLIAPLFVAGIRMANPPDAYPHDWRDGMGAFGRDYGNTLAIRSALDTGRFLTGAVLHVIQQESTRPDISRAGLHRHRPIGFRRSPACRREFCRRGSRRIRRQSVFARWFQQSQPRSNPHGDCIWQSGRSKPAARI